MSRQRLPKVTVIGNKKVRIDEQYASDGCNIRSKQLAGEKFSWCTDDGNLVIEFPNNHSPFGSACKMTAQKSDWTAPVSVDPHTTPGRYPYTVKINGVEHDDPVVIIDPGTVSDGDRDSESLMLLGDPGGVAGSAKEMLMTVVSQLTTASQGSPTFFKDGIELISVDVEIGPVKVILKIAGPKAPNS